VHVERGSGLAALFIHGYPLNGYQWRGALERLSPYRRCITPDLLGLGYTETSATQDLSPSAQTTMLAELLDALGVDAVDLVANDSGGAIAQLFLVRYPQRVRTVLLTNCDVHENSPPAKLRPSIERAKKGTYADERLLPQLREPEYARGPNGIGGGAYTNPANFTDESIEYYFAPLVSTPLRKAQVNQYAVAFDPNPLLAIEPQLRRSAQPVRMVWGTGDHLFPVSWAEWLDRTLPGSRGVRLVEGAKLFFPEEMPDLIAEEARALWL
jgi:pimeloyl-ACP methyl ester carboxylesterase